MEHPNPQNLPSPPLCPRWSIRHLAQSLKNTDAHRGGQIQTPRLSPHRDSQTRLRIRMEQGLRQPLRFPAENQPIALLEFAFPQPPPSLRGEKPKPRPLACLTSESFEGIPKSHIAFLPVIHAGTAERLFIQRKSKRPDKMQTRPDRQAKPRHIARIRGNLRLD